MRLQLRIVVSSVLLFTLAACSVLGIDDSPAPPLTKAQAKKGLLTLADVPAGWTRVSDEASDDVPVTHGSKACKQLLDDPVDPDDEAPTAVERSYSSPDESASIGSSIESFTEGFARRDFNQGVMAIDACDRFTWKYADGLTIRLTLELVHFKDLGDDSVAFRLVGSAAGGPKVFADAALVRVGQNVISVNTFRVGSAMPSRKLRHYVKLVLAKLEKVD